MNRTLKSWSSWTLATSLICALALTSLATAQHAPAPTDTARAESLSAEAFDAYRRADYDQAIALYRKAYEALPSADILYNLARIYDTKLKDRALAIEYYERYSNDPEAEPGRREKVEKRLSTLRELEAEAVPSTAATQDRSTAATFGQTIAPGAPQTSEPTSGGLSSTQVLGILVGAVGVAAIGVGTGFGLSARADAEIAHELCDGNVCISQRGVDAAEDADRDATISTISCAAGGVLLAGGIALLVFGPRDREREVAAVRILPYATAGSLGTQLAGRW